MRKITVVLTTLILGGCAYGLSPGKPMMEASHEARVECQNLYPAKDPKDANYMECVRRRSSQLWLEKNEAMQQRQENSSYVERAWDDIKDSTSLIWNPMQKD